MTIPPELLKKYNRPVPRYTSYPPANFFHANFSEDDYINAVLRSNEKEPQNISLYIHVPFCNRICHYCGCNSMKIRESEFVKKYMEAVRKELSIFRRHISCTRSVSQLHWGGGTPNSLPIEEILAVMELIRNKFIFTKNPEIAIECNPAGLSNDYIDALAEAGFNRISLGIQDFRREVLEAVNREIPDRPVNEIVSYCKLKGIKVNLDFIYGLPLQNEKSFGNTITQAIAANPDRLVTFSYAHVPWVKAAQKKLEEYGLPGPDEKTRMFETASGLLKAAGYKAIGLDHYARPEDELYVSLQNKSLHRNFQGYCTRETTGQVYAAGISSISQLWDAYAQNTKNINHYIDKLNQGKLPVEKGYRLTSDEILIRDAITELMCNFYLDPEDFARRKKISPEEFYSITRADNNELEEFRKDGLIKDKGTKIEAEEYGKFFIRIIAAALDPLQKTDNNRQFSKSI